MSNAPEIDGVTGLTEIGRGGFGVVFRGTETEFHRTVAVKVLAPSLDERTRRRFERERRAMGSLSGHPNIVTVYRGGVTATQQPYLVMEYLPGGSLGDHLHERGALDWRAVARIGAKISEALETAHRAGILHRDVKPANVFQTAGGEPKLGDFGIARLDDGQDSRSGSITASIAHAAPEIVDGMPGDERSDLYSLASTLYALATGHSPFSREGDQGLTPMLARIASQPAPPMGLESAAAAFEAAVMTALSKRPDDRQPSVSVFAEQLRRAAASAASGTSPTEASASASSIFPPAVPAASAPAPSAPAPSTPVPSAPVASAAVPTVPASSASSASVAATSASVPAVKQSGGHNRMVQAAVLLVIAVMVAAVGGWAANRALGDSDPSPVASATAAPVATPTSPPIDEPTAQPTSPPAEPAPTPAALPTLAPPPPATPSVVRTPTFVGARGGNQTITDPSGAITITVPNAWATGVVTGDDPELAEFEGAFSALAIGGDFDQLGGEQGVRDVTRTGVAIVATRLPAPVGTPAELLDLSLDTWSDCTFGERVELELDPGPADAQIMVCQDDGSGDFAGVVVLGLVPTGDPNVAVVMSLQLADEGDSDRLVEVAASLRVDPTKVREFNPGG